MGKSKISAGFRKREYSKTTARNTAKEKGKKTYVGTQCRKCKAYLRLTSTGSCVACSKARKYVSESAKSSLDDAMLRKVVKIAHSAFNVTLAK